MLFRSKFTSIKNPNTHLDPKAPVNLTSSNVMSTSVDLNWDEVSQADGYYVYQDGVQIDDVSTETLTVENLDPETEYEFYLTSYRDTYESKKSDLITVTTTA
ncbi:fibronectin type III domain-containing protein [Alkalibacillus sp. S2W]|uniref:fibronectin type III domain-containing protein n=1 Tax=Alkalibacillus sp. S2W TaxID=3386553 RepID=UPI00398D0E1B